MADLTLRNAIVVTPGGLLRGGLAVTDGVITQVTADAELPAATTEVDVAGKYLIPGIIDPHVHLGIGDGAGPEKLERDFASESRDAAAGGVTTRQHLREADVLVKAGIRSFKFFLGYKGAQAESFGMNSDGISWDFFYGPARPLAPRARVPSPPSTPRTRTSATSSPSASVAAAAATCCRPGWRPAPTSSSRCRSTRPR